MSGMVGRSQQASGDMCGHVHWKERRKERKEREMIDENERKKKGQKALCEQLRKVWDITLRWSVSRCYDYF